MLQEAANRHLSRMLLIFSDLCECDADIAACLTFMRIQAPPGEALWTASNVRQQMPGAFSTVTSTSLYAANVNSDLKLIQFFSDQRFKTDTPRHRKRL